MTLSKATKSPVASTASPAMSNAKKKKEGGSEKRFSIDHTIQCLLLAYPKDKPSSVFKSTVSSGQKEKSTLGQNTRQGSGDLVKPARQASAKTLPIEKVASPPEDSGKERGSQSRRRSSFASALGKILSPTSKKSHASCLSVCKTKRTSSIKKHSRSAIVPVEGAASPTSIPPSVVSGPVTSTSKHQPNVYIKYYIDAFRELCHLLSKFGVTLSFVVTNLIDTIEVLEFHIKNDKDKRNYEHVDKMIRYELKAKLIQKKIKGKDSGTKNLLLLHRSLAFILEFIKGLKNSNSKTNSVDVAQQAFDKTMAQYYSWLVNKMASVAFNALPTTKECLSRITNNEPQTATAQLKKLIEAATPVYDRVQSIYSHHQQLKCV